jgi:hypothetical protein
MTGSGSAHESGMWGSGKGARTIGKWLGLHRPRGAVVPFESPALRMARVCDDERDGLIAILRDFANNGTAYIVPWTSLPAMVTMTDHDVALHTAVQENNASTPEQVRSVVRDLALSGALGPEARAREMTNAASQTSQADVELVLILHLLNSCGASLTGLMETSGRTRDVNAKAAIAKAAATIGVERREIYRRVAELAKLIGPVGLATTDGSIHSGWLRVLHDEIDGFSQSLLAAPPVSDDASPHLAAVAETARRIARLSDIIINMLDYAVLDIGGTIRRWSTELPVLRQAIDRLSATLDEWPMLMKAVRDCLRCPSDEMTMQLRMLRNVLPVVPDMDTLADGPEKPASVSQVLGARLAALGPMLSAHRQEIQR